MKKLIVYLVGGSGNNYFQLSFGEKLKLEGYNVVYNNYLTKKNIFTGFLGWSIHSSCEVDQILSDEKVISHFGILDVIYLFIVFFLSRLNVFDITSSSRNKVFFGRALGYWQRGMDLNPSILNRIRKLYSRDSIRVETDSYIGKNVIHMRRGDFKECDQLTFKYYNNAIKKLDCKSYLLVTNDMSIFKEFQDTLEPSVIIEKSIGKSEKEDFLIMMGAKNLIMSNSTFCYWASQVGDVENIVFPSMLANKKEWDLSTINRNSIKIDADFNTGEDGGEIPESL